jgi:hypothetical protein
MTSVKFKGMLILMIDGKRKIAKHLTPERRAFIKALGLTPHVFTEPKETG